LKETKKELRKSIDDVEDEEEGDQLPQKKK
jgi:hypothetical protein